MIAGRVLPCLPPRRPVCQSRGPRLVAASIVLAVGLLSGGSLVVAANAAKRADAGGRTPAVPEAGAAACESVSGHLADLDASGSQTVGRMSGSVEGDYAFGYGGVVASDPNDAALVFGVGTSTITREDGTLRLRETASQDTAAQSSDVNTAVLATVIGGTGRWAGASGHLVYAGFFHASTLSGDFRYSGTLCTPARARFAAAAGPAARAPTAPTSAAGAGCEIVTGRLVDLDASQAPTVGRMEGSIEGDYEFGFGGAVATDPTDAARIFAVGTSTVTRDEGTLTLRETASEDTSDQSSDTNTAVLATVIGGTGRWAGASGHLVYAGYFHASALSGRFGYTGTICSPVAAPPSTPPAAPRKRPKKASSAYGRGVAASMRPLTECPPRNRLVAARTTSARTAATAVCGFQATFSFSALPAKGSTLRTAWYYNRRFVGTVPKPKAKLVKSFIAFSRAAPRGFYWCDLIVKPPGKPPKAVGRAITRR